MLALGRRGLLDDALAATILMPRPCLCQDRGGPGQRNGLRRRCRWCSYLDIGGGDDDWSMLTGLYPLLECTPLHLALLRGDSCLVQCIMSTAGQACDARAAAYWWPSPPRSTSLTSLRPSVAGEEGDCKQVQPRPLTVGPLHLAVLSGRVSAVRALLQCLRVEGRGLDAVAKSANGLAAVRVARAPLAGKDGHLGAGESMTVIKRVKGRTPIKLSPTAVARLANSAHRHHNEMTLLRGVVQQRDWRGQTARELADMLGEVTNRI